MEQENAIGQGIENLEKYLPEGKMEELAEILEYGEKMKVEGERLKQEFRSKHTRKDFLNLLKTRKEREEKYGEYLDKLSPIEREKFIEEYLHDMIIYSGDVEKIEFKEGIEYFYEEWKNGEIEFECGDRLDLYRKRIGYDGAKAIAKMELKEGVSLDLGRNEFGAEGAKAIAEKMELKEGVELNLEGNIIGAKGAKAIAGMELKEGVKLNLSYNGIGDDGAKAIVEEMELKEGVALDLGSNQIGVAGAQAISKSMKLENRVCLWLGDNRIGAEGAKAIAGMKLKEGVKLDLSNNEIGAEGAKAIAGMELKEGVTLNLQGNGIGDDMKARLKAREKSYHDKGIQCEVLVD